MQTKAPESVLIAEALGGNHGAFAELIKLHQRYVFTLALKMVKNREDAEEVAQDCFVKAYRSLSSFQQQSKFSTWLYRIVFNTSMTFLRKNRLPTNSIDDEASQLQLESYSSNNTGERVEKQSKYQYLQHAIAQLLPDDAAIITLFYQGEQSLEEIGQSLQMNPDTVKVKLHRARQRLKVQLENLLNDEVKELI
jgi:RNA polymerase sigma factor (sigma-70 family)